MPKLEREFLTKLKQSFLEKNCFYHKIADLPHFEGAKFRFDAKKPFDVFAFYNGVPIAIEAKAYRQFKSISTKQLRPNQIEGLEKASKHAMAYVFVNIRIRGDKALRTKTVNRLYIFNWDELRNTVYSKSELLTRPFIAADGMRFNLDSFLIDVEINHHLKFK